MTKLSTAGQELARRLDDRSATIAIVGLGYVGLPLARVMHDAGFTVIGYDSDDRKIQWLSDGTTYLHHLGEDLVRTLSASDRFSPTRDPNDLAACDAVILCVPSPLGKHGEPDMSYIVASTEMCAEHIKPGSLVVLESTTYPGTTRGDCLPILERAGRKLGEDLFVAFSPEREDPGRKDHDTQTIPKLVGGLDEASTHLAHKMYAAGVKTAVAVDSAEIAEAAKLLENIYRAVNIALVNELKPVLQSMGIDIWKVVAAAATKPFGFQPFYPGPGLGGHCIPIDPFYLTWKAKEFGHHTKFIELAGEINSSMPRYVVQRTATALNERGKALRNSKILVVGVAYKPDVDDVRETPAAEIIKQLFELGADVSYHDPHVPELEGMRKYDLAMRSVELTRDALGAVDCVLIVTDHKAVDWALIADAADVIVDTRNTMANLEPKGLLVRA
ncbi:MAG: nucleotide sugar dehydrogenase [Planctomycetes bacterium]|nr:nucleotide sugar dehydrogenase [Planctomycetota bacterium]